MNKLSKFLWCLLLVTGIVSAQWTEQTSGVTTQLTSISAVSDNNAWICGYAGKVLRTTNGGSTWTSVTNPSAADNYNIYAIDSMNALVTASPGATFVYRTTNGGSTWTQVFTQAGGFIDAIWMNTPTTGFMYGDPVSGRWSLWKTTNGGANWDSTGLYLPQAAAEAGWNNALFMQVTAIWFGTNTTHVYYSPTNGTTGTWVQQTTTAGGNEYSIWFNTPTSGLCGGTALNQTTNAGVTWSTLTAPGTANVSGITGLGANYWFTRQTNLIYKTTNNGTSFTTDYTGPVGAVYNHINIARTGTRLWACTSIGGISKSDQLLGVTPVSNEVPSSFSLSQNYPNPFNPSTTIRYSIPQAANVSVKIYDMLGNEVMTVVNEHQNAGTYAGTVDASNLASGVYFYTIKAGSFTDTKKMMLIK